MNWKKTSIKVVVAICAIAALKSVGGAVDVGITNSTALLQMQNTPITLLTNQTFNKTMVVIDMIMYFVLGYMFSPEATYILKRFNNKGEDK